MLNAKKGEFHLAVRMYTLAKELQLDSKALADHFAGDQSSMQQALLALLEALGEGRATSLTAPGLWTFESAVQSLPGSAVSAGYRNLSLQDRAG